LNLSKQSVEKQEKICTCPKVVPIEVEPKIPNIGEDGKAEVWDADEPEVGHPSVVFQILERMRL